MVGMKKQTVNARNLKNMENGFVSGALIRLLKFISRM